MRMEEEWGPADSVISVLLSQLRFPHLAKDRLPLIHLPKRFSRFQFIILFPLQYLLVVAKLDLIAFANRSNCCINPCCTTTMKRLSISRHTTMSPSMAGYIDTVAWNSDYRYYSLWDSMSSQSRLNMVKRYYSSSVWELHSSSFLRASCCTSFTYRFKDIVIVRVVLQQPLLSYHILLYTYIRYILSLCREASNSESRTRGRGGGNTSRSESMEQWGQRDTGVAS